MSSWCAICTSERGSFVQRSLGRRDALVTVCSRCDDEHPRSGHYGFNGGIPDGRVSGDGNRRVGPRHGHGRSAR